MNKAFLIGLLSIIFLPVNGQKISIANEKFNIFYAELNNPLAIAVENISSKAIVVKATKGVVGKENGSYFFRHDSVGTTDIVLFKKKRGQLKEVGRSSFRIKAVPAPVFKIGSGKKKVSDKEIAAQEFVRAELENIDIDINYSIKNFSVFIISEDTCSIKKFDNEGRKIKNEIRLAFNNLKNGDTVLFKDIFITEPSGNEKQLEDVIINIISKK